MCLGQSLSESFMGSFRGSDTSFLKTNAEQAIVSVTGPVTWANHRGPWKRKKSGLYRRTWELLEREERRAQGYNP